MTWYNRNTIRVLHIPTGIVAVCGSEHSQHRNKAKALNLLRAKLWAAVNLAGPAEVVRTYDLKGTSE